MMLRLDPPMWLSTPRGQALAHFLIDRGIDYDLEWVCFQQDSGECWTYLNSDIRAVDNLTLHRKVSRKKK